MDMSPVNVTVWSPDPRTKVALPSSVIWSVASPQVSPQKEPVHVPAKFGAGRVVVVVVEGVVGVVAVVVEVVEVVTFVPSGQ